MISSSKLIFFYNEKNSDKEFVIDYDQKYVSKDKLYMNSPRTTEKTQVKTYGNLGNLTNKSSIKII